MYRYKYTKCFTGFHVHQNFYAKAMEAKKGDNQRAGGNSIKFWYCLDSRDTRCVMILGKVFSHNFGFVWYLIARQWGLQTHVLDFWKQLCGHSRKKFLTWFQVVFAFCFSEKVSHTVRLLCSLISGTHEVLDLFTISITLHFWTGLKQLHIACQR